MEIQNVSSNAEGTSGKQAKDIWSVDNKGIFIKGEQKVTFEKLSKASELDPKQDAQLKKACKDFESFFLYYLLKQMRGTGSEEGLLDNGRAMQIYRDMFDDEVSKKVAESKGIGIASMMYDNVKRMLIQIESQKFEVK